MRPLPEGRRRATESDAVTFWGAAAPTYAIYGGVVALRGPIADLLEGNLDVKHDTRLVVLRFPSLERARAWWHSPQYQAAVKLRQHPVSDSRVFLVDGIDLGGQH